MAGLSIARRTALARAASSAVVNSTTKKKHVIHRHHPLTTRSSDGTALSPYVIDRELPAAWAMACMAFTGVVEFSRFVSPSGFAIDLASNFSADADASTENQQSIVPSIFSETISWLPELLNKQSTLRTIADYTIGGAMGGALFAGSAVRTRAGSKIDAAILGTAIRSGGPLAGLVPGAGLGLLAGVTVVSIDLVREMLEEQFGEVDKLPQQEEIKPIQNNADQIPGHIKAMSNEELAKAIEDLKR